jgi:hypothetical protein
MTDTISSHLIKYGGWISLASTEICCGLEGPEIETMLGNGFPCDPDGAEKHTASCTLGTGYFSGVEQLKHRAKPCPFSAALRMF